MLWPPDNSNQEQVRIQHGGIPILGPGYEFTDKKDKFLVRIGAGYEFHLRGNWSIAPEFVFDYIENHTTVWMAGLALGYQF